mgnify:FL=1
MGPLNGIKVLEFSGIGPGPYCGMLLADLGADVIRLSRLNEKGMYNKFDIHNRSKRTIVADLKNPKAIKEIKKLIKEMDVLFEGFRPGVMEKLGLGPESCFKLNKSLVYGRMTGWGQDGPMSNQAGHDINYISLSGALNAIGDKNSNPSIPLNLIGDYGGGGMMLAMGILAGVISSSKTGKGQVIDAAMIDGSLSLMSFFYSLKAMGIWKDKRKSNLLDGAAHFYDTYKCSDNKYIAVGSIESQFYKILLDKLELTDPRFKNQMDQSMWEELKEIIATKIKSQSRDHWVEIFSDTDGCVTPVLNMDEAQEHKHNISRESFINLEGFNQPAPAPRFSNDTLSIKHNAKEIGSDIDNICDEFNLDTEAFS